MEKRYDDVAVYTTYVAKRLLGKGYRIMNLSKNKYDETKVVFYFKNEVNILEDLKILLCEK